MAFFVHVCQYRIRLCLSSTDDHPPSACTVLSLVISVAVRYCGACRGRTRERTRGRTRRHRRSKSARPPAIRGSAHCRRTPRLRQSGRAGVEPRPPPTTPCCSPVIGPSVRLLSVPPRLRKNLRGCLQGGLPG